MAADKKNVQAAENTAAQGNTAPKTGEVAEKSSNRVAFSVMEAYKMIRTNLVFSLATSEKRIAVFSSAEPSAGKSTLSANLAIVMAQTGARVALVDADMRKPAQHRNFKVARTMGLSKILGGLATLDECLCKDVKPNVDLIPSGPTPPNPSELLGSARMVKLLEELNEKYDYVFIDTPPMCVVADALVVAPYTSGVVLVARHNHTAYEEFGEALEKVEAANVNLLGAVISDMNVHENGYSRYGKYGKYSRYSRYSRYSLYNRYSRYGYGYGYRYYRNYNYEYGNRR